MSFGIRFSGVSQDLVFTDFPAQNDRWSASQAGVNETGSGEGSNESGHCER